MLFTEPTIKILLQKEPINHSFKIDKQTPVEVEVDIFYFKLKFFNEFRFSPDEVKIWVDQGNSQF